MFSLDRVSDTSTTVGTGDFTLTGTAPAGYVSLYAACNGQLAHYNEVVSFTYLITMGADYEIGVGYVEQTQLTSGGASGAVLNRGNVIRSSNADALVNFGAGTKTVQVVSSSVAVPSVGRNAALVTNPYSATIADGYTMGSFVFQIDIEPMGPGTTAANTVWVCTSSADTYTGWARLWGVNDEKWEAVSLAGDTGYRLRAMVLKDSSGTILGDYLTHTMRKASTRGATPHHTLAFNPSLLGTQLLATNRATAVHYADGNKSGSTNNMYIAMGLGISIVKGFVTLMQEDDVTKYRVYEITATIRSTQSGATTTSTAVQSTATSVHDTSAGVLSLAIDGAAQSSGNMRITWGRSNAGNTAVTALFDVHHVTTAADRADDGV